ncbi:hypothetical protein ACI2KX_06900 [Ectopseudomonas khazarica]|uniref:Uncharacterized protein n=1 Tax=Ectopseudomonas oleovorans TaxID=301 RepID=A0A653B8W0_ECTOL|nr:conserved protein of unknown function [Pseudomonas oleovorans]HIQ41650.1 hypothetical protein [Pseudomonas oleovorans]
MDEVKQLQAMIKQRLEGKGMSLAELAEKIFVEDHDEDDDAALKRFQASLKKQLSRPSTSPEKLRRYLEILLTDRRGLEGHYPSVASSYLPKQVLNQMHKLSAEIEALLLKK